MSYEAKVDIKAMTQRENGDGERPNGEDSPLLGRRASADARLVGARLN